MFEKEISIEDEQISRIDNLNRLYDDIEEVGDSFDFDGCNWTIECGGYRTKPDETNTLKAMWLEKKDTDGRIVEFGLSLEPTNEGSYESFVVIHPIGLSEDEAKRWENVQIETGLDVLNNEDWEQIDKVINFMNKRRIFNSIEKLLLT